MHAARSTPFNRYFQGQEAQVGGSAPATPANGRAPRDSGWRSRRVDEHEMDVRQPTITAQHVVTDVSESTIVQRVVTHPAAYQKGKPSGSAGKGKGKDKPGKGKRWTPYRS